MTNKKASVLICLAIVVGFTLILFCFLKNCEYRRFDDRRPNKENINLNQADFNDNQASTSQTQTGIANPASVNCKNNGGNLVIQKNPNGGEYGLCFFDDNRACEEWAMMRGDCPLGGVKTTGYDSEAQKYCAWLGGDTIAQENAICNFKDGSFCLDDDLYNGKCIKGEKKSSPTITESSNKPAVGSFKIEKVTGEKCSSNNDCTLPFEYAIRSSCPYESKCLENKCTVVCQSF